MWIFVKEENQGNERMTLFIKSELNELRFDEAQFVHSDSIFPIP